MTLAQSGKGGLQVWPLVTAIGIVGVSYVRLIDYRGLDGSWPVMVGWLFFAFGLAPGYTAVGLHERRRFGILCLLGTIAGGLASMWLSGRFLDGRYPSLLDSLLQVRYACIHLVCALAQSHSCRPWPGAIDD